MVMKIILIIFLIGIIFSCQKNNTSSESRKSESVLKPEIKLSDVSINNCLNVEKIIAHLQNSRFQFPAAIMTTQFHSLGDISVSKDQFMSYTNFYYKSGIPNELNLMSVASQTDCNTIQLYTSSHEILNFKIMEHSDRHLQFRLIDQFDQSVMKPKKRALFKRIQPYEYEVTYVTEKKLKFVEKYTTFDPLCLTKKNLNFEVTKMIAWGSQLSELPESYEIEVSFLNKIKSSLVNEIGITHNVLSIADIKSLMQAPIREDLKLCL